MTLIQWEIPNKDTLLTPGATLSFKQKATMWLYLRTHATLLHPAFTLMRMKSEKGDWLFLCGLECATIPANLVWQICSFCLSSCIEKAQVLHCSTSGQKEVIFFRICICTRCSPDFQASHIVTALQIYTHVQAGDFMYI